MQSRNLNVIIMTKVNKVLWKTRETRLVALPLEEVEGVQGGS